MINALSSSLAYLNCALKERSRPRRLRHSYVKTVLLPLLLAAAPALNALLSLLYAPLQLHLQGELRSLGSAISRDIVTENPNVNRIVLHKLDDHNQSSLDQPEAA
eukprot:scaffold289046_cov22-Tisochrysis_lutea.AAC.1